MRHHMSSFSIYKVRYDEHTNALCHDEGKCVINVFFLNKKKSFLEGKLPNPGQERERLNIFQLIQIQYFGGLLESL